MRAGACVCEELALRFPVSSMFHVRAEPNNAHCVYSRLSFGWGNATAEWHLNSTRNAQVLLSNRQRWKGVASGTVSSPKVRQSPTPPRILRGSKGDATVPQPGVREGRPALEGLWTLRGCAAQHTEVGKEALWAASGFWGGCATQCKEGAKEALWAASGPPGGTKPNARRERRRSSGRPLDHQRAPNPVRQGNEGDAVSAGK